MRHFTIVLALVFSLFFFTSCGVVSTASSSSAHSSQLITGSYGQINVPPYAEYVPLQMVFVTTEEYENIDSPYLTYLALLKKASDLGGHAIVNVSIEESRNCTKLTRAVPPYQKDETACRVKRFGAALAIKYTKIIDIEKAPAPTTPNDVSTSHEQVKTSSILPF